MGRLEGRIAVVTGAGRGIGRATALAYGREGARVVVASRTPSTVDSVVEEIRSSGGEALGVVVDVASRDEVHEMIATAVGHFGGLDVLVNNAQAFGTPDHPEGSPGFVKLEDFPEAVWDYTFQTGLKATLYGMQAAFPHMRERGGKIINVGSGNGQTAMTGTAAYNANKEAIRTLTRTAAKEWGRYSVCVNVIVPNMLTESAEDFFAARPGIQDKLVSQIPLRRFGDLGRDLGPVMVFLASQESDYVTGHTVNIDGGQVLYP